MEREKNMYTLTKSNLDIAVISKKQNPACLFVDRHCTVVNDGRVLVRVTRPDIDPDTYPNIDGIKVSGSMKDQADIEPVENDSFILDSAEAIKIGKKIPGKKTINPVLQQAIVSQNGKIQIASTDLNGQDVTTVNPLGGIYPKYQEVIPPENNTKMRIGFDPAYMETICKLAKDFQNQQNASDNYRLMYMDIGGPGSAIKLHTRNIETKQEFLAVLMPMNITSLDDDGYSDARKPSVESKKAFYLAEVERLENELEIVKDKINIECDNL